MNFELPAEQQRIQTLAREFAQQELAPIIRQADERCEFPLHLVRRMGELGLLAGPTGELPSAVQEHGLAAHSSYLSYAIVSEELGRVDSSMRVFMNVHAGLVIGSIQQRGSDEQKARYLPRLISGEWIGCYALTEPRAGSDAASIETTCRQAGNGYVLSGEKIWISNGLSADVSLVFATVDASLRHKGICLFIIEAGTPGFRRVPMPDRALGHRASEHAHLFLEECHPHFVHARERSPWWARRRLQSSHVHT